MSLKDIALVKAYHAHRAARFGSDAPEALGWKDRASQQEKFSVLSQIGPLQGTSVLDVGCGYGDMYSYFKNEHGDFDYVGIDNVSSFLEVGAKRFRDECNVKFLLGDFSSLFLPKADYVICCGALNYQHSDPDYLIKMLNRFYDASALGVGVSLLERVDFEDGILAKYDSERVIEHCNQLASKVELIRDPQRGSYTIFLYRKRQEH